MFKLKDIKVGNVVLYCDRYPYIITKVHKGGQVDLQDIYTKNVFKAEISHVSRNTNVRILSKLEAAIRFGI